MRLTETGTEDCTDKQRQREEVGIEKETGRDRNREGCTDKQRQTDRGCRDRKRDRNSEDCTDKQRHRQR